MKKISEKKGLSKKLMKQMNYSFQTVNLTNGVLINCWLLNVLLRDTVLLNVSEAGNLLILADWIFDIDVC